MDFERKAEAGRRRFRRIATISALLLMATGVTVGLARLEPAAPRVARGSVWIDTVKRGPMLREVHGTGALIPVEIRSVAAQTQGRVERILVLPGSVVRAETVLVELINPELQQAELETGWQLQAAEAELKNLRVQLESQRLTQQATAASFKFEQTQAELEAQADEELAGLGLVPLLVVKRSRAKADELRDRCAIEGKRLEICGESAEAQIAVQQAKVEQLRAQRLLKQQQVQSLRVRAGLDGVLQKLGDKEPLQLGQLLPAGATVARVADPSRLKAEVKVPETQAKDVLIGQTATVDTRNGVINAEVERIDPAVQNGTVTVDVRLTGPLPKGCRPDLSIDGTIELEKLDDVLSVGRPVQGQPESAARLFKVCNGGREAVRVEVKLGRGSVNAVEVRGGLAAGDQVILSDMSQWDAHSRVRLN